LAVTMLFFIWISFLRLPTILFRQGDEHEMVSLDRQQRQTQEGQPNGSEGGKQSAHARPVRWLEYPRAAADESGLLPVSHPTQADCASYFLECID
jgi:hypothetical protein